MVRLRLWANKTFILQASLTIIAYDCQSLFIAQAIVEWKSMFHTLLLNIEGATEKVFYNATDFKFAK